MSFKIFFVSFNFKKIQPNYLNFSNMYFFLKHKYNWKRDLFAFIIFYKNAIFCKESALSDLIFSKSLNCNISSASIDTFKKTNVNLVLYLYTSPYFLLMIISKTHLFWKRTVLKKKQCRIFFQFQLELEKPSTKIS